MNVQGILGELISYYGDEFCWFIPSNKEVFEKQLARELPPSHPLANLGLKAVLKSERNDDVIFFADGKFYLFHLTWSKNIQNFMPFREITNLKEFLEDDFKNG